MNINNHDRVANLNKCCKRQKMYDIQQPCVKYVNYVCYAYDFL